MRFRKFVSGSAEVTGAPLWALVALPNKVARTSRLRMALASGTPSATALFSSLYSQVNTVILRTDAERIGAVGYAVRS